MTREVVLDTETTGFEPSQGHRLVEIGCIELINHVPTGKTFHTYINPEREVPEEAYAVHGLSFDFLKAHPCFKEIVSSFLEFIGDAPLVIHNAKFDMKFINAELTSHGGAEIPFSRAIDTLLMARQKFPGSPASLDALCKRFGVNNEAREKHGALLDAELLAQVYLELRGGKQPGLSLERAAVPQASQEGLQQEKVYRAPRPFSPSEEELKRHQHLVENLNSPLWKEVGDL